MPATSRFRDAASASGSKENLRASTRLPVFYHFLTGFDTHNDMVCLPSPPQRKLTTCEVDTSLSPPAQDLSQYQHGTSSYKREDADLLDQRFEEMVFK
jgi:hypothetical protein